MENQSAKYGNVQKCPQCGAPVEPMSVKCSTCGYEFRNVEALKSAQVLAAKLDSIAESYRNKEGGIFKQNDYQIYKIREQATAIKNFPVPNTKEDLLDFAITMQSRWKTEENFDLNLAYKSKYNECINKAKILFPNDPMFQGLFDQNKKDNRKMSKKTKNFLIPLLIAFLFFAIAMIMAFFVDK